MRYNQCPAGWIKWQQSDKNNVLGIIRKQAIESAIYLYGGVVLGFVITGVLAPNFLSKSEIGALNLLMSFSGIFASFGLLGFTTATMRHFPQFRNPEKKHHGFLFLALTVGAVGFLLFLIAYYPLKPLIIEQNQEKSPLLAEYFYLIIPLTFFQIYFSLLDVYSNMLYRASIGMFLREFLQRFLTLAGLILLIFHLLDFGQYVYLYTAAVCLPTLVLAGYLILKKEFHLKPDLSLLDKPMLQGLLDVSLFGFLNNFSSFAVLRIDAIMVFYYIDDAATGIYVTTFYFGALVLMPSKALGKIAPALIADAFKREDTSAIRDIYHKGSLNLFIIGLLIFLGLMINMDNIFRIIPGDFAAGKYVILLIGLSNLIKMANGLSDSVIVASRYYRYTTLFLVIMLVATVLFNMLFIPGFGLTGAAIASALAIALHNLAKAIFIYRKFGFQPFRTGFLYLLLISAGIYAVCAIIPTFPSLIVDILVRSTTALAVYGMAVLGFRFSPDLNQLAEELLKRLRIK